MDYLKLMAKKMIVPPKKHLLYYFSVLLVFFCSCVPLIYYHKDKKIIQSLKNNHHISSKSNIVLYLCDENNKLLLLCPEGLQSIPEYRLGIGSVAWGIGVYRHLLFVFLIDENNTHYYSYKFDGDSYIISCTPIVKVQSTYFVNFLTYPSIGKEPFMFFINSNEIRWKSYDDYIRFYNKWTQMQSFVPITNNLPDPK